jgi:hypothetical protein
MRLTWALLALFEAVTADTYGAVALKAGCVNAVGCAGYYRALGVSTSPAGSSFGPPSTVTAVSVAAIGVQAASNGTISAGTVDVAGMKFKTPADMSDGSDGSLSFYFGYLGVSGVWNNDTQTGAVAGALAEVVSVLSSVEVYYDNDNQAGFHWDLSPNDPTKRYDIFNNADGEAKGYDTLDSKGNIDCVQNLTWTPMTHTRIQCNTIPALSNMPDSCEIHSLRTSGFLSTSNSTTPVLTVVARIATHPIMINNNQHGPDRVKFDIEVQYPWADMSSLYSASKAKLLLISFAAGKAGDFVGAAIPRGDGSDSLVFAAAGSKASGYVAYKQTAMVDGTSAPVTTQVITGAEISAFTCTGAPCAGALGLGLTATNIIAAVLKTKVAWLQAFGWRSSLAFHALGTTAAPVDILWDPEVGTSATTTNSAAFSVPSALLLLLTFLLF